MRYISVAMLCEHVTRGPKAVRRAIKRSGISVERFPGAQGVRLTEADANELIARHWPVCGPIPPASATRASEVRLAVIEIELKRLGRYCEDLNQNDTAYLSAVTELKSQILALRSIVSELVQAAGFPASTVDRAADARAAHFLDAMLLETEKTNPVLAAALDLRDASMISTEKGYPALFPKP